MLKIVDIVSGVDTLYRSVLSVPWTQQRSKTNTLNNLPNHSAQPLPDSSVPKIRIKKSSSVCVKTGYEILDTRVRKVIFRRPLF